jgi:hypothetical protein
MIPVLDIFHINLDLALSAICTQPKPSFIFPVLAPVGTVTEPFKDIIFVL